MIGYFRPSSLRRLASACCLSWTSALDGADSGDRSGAQKPPPVSQSIPSSSARRLLSSLTRIRSCHDCWTLASRPRSSFAPARTPARASISAGSGGAPACEPAPVPSHGPRSTPKRFASARTSFSFSVSICRAIVLARARKRSGKRDSTSSRKPFSFGMPIAWQAWVIAVSSCSTCLRWSSITLPIEVPADSDESPIMSGSPTGSVLPIQRSEGWAGPRPRRRSCSAIVACSRPAASSRCWMSCRMSVPGTSFRSTSSSPAGSGSTRARTLRAYASLRESSALSSGAAGTYVASPDGASAWDWSGSA